MLSALDIGSVEARVAAQLKHTSYSILFALVVMENAVFHTNISHGGKTKWWLLNVKRIRDRGKFCPESF